MANTCNNYITLSPSDEELYTKFLAFIDKLEETEKDYETTNGKEWMCNPQLDGNSLNAESRWVPCIYAMVELAKMYKLSFNLEYEEGGHCLFGEYQYDYGTNKLHLRELTEKEWIVDDDTLDSWYDEMDNLLTGKSFEEIEDHQNIL